MPSIHGYHRCLNVAPFALSIQESNTLYGGEPDQHFGKGDTVSVVVTPNDSLDSGPPVESAGVTIDNTPPTSPVIAVLSADGNTPFAGETDLVCTIQTPSIDPDPEDTIHYVYTWYNPEGHLQLSHTDTAETHTFPGTTPTTYGDWRCTVQATDNESVGATVLDTLCRL